MLIHSIAHFDLPGKRSIAARSIDKLCNKHDIAAQGSFGYQAADPNLLQLERVSSGPDRIMQIVKAEPRHGAHAYRLARQR